MPIIICSIVNLFLVFIHIHAHITYQLIFEKPQRTNTIFKYLHPFIPYFIFSLALFELSFFQISIPYSSTHISFSLFIVMYSASYLQNRSFTLVYILFTILSFYPQLLFPSYLLTGGYCVSILLICLLLKNEVYSIYITYFIIGFFTFIIFIFFNALTYTQSGQTLFLIMVIYLFGIIFYIPYVWSIKKSSNICMELRDSQIRTDSLFNNKQIGIIRINERNIIVEYNEMISTMFGTEVNTEEWIGINFFDFALGSLDIMEYPEQFTEQLLRIKEDKKETLNDLVFLKNGTAFERDFLPLNIDNMYKGAYINFRNISERVQSEKMLQQLKIEFEKLSQTDPLTGLYNRRKMDSDLQTFIHTHSKSNEPLTFILLDIDFFKNYNDYYGHYEGDICLQNVAKILKETTRKEYDIVYRYGGEEFSILLLNTNEELARIISQNIIDTINNTNIPHANSLISNHLTISLGVVTWQPNHTTITIQQLIEHSDHLLYQSKQYGRNRFLFEKIY